MIHDENKFRIRKLSKYRRFCERLIKTNFTEKKKYDTRKRETNDKGEPEKKLRII